MAKSDSVAVAESETIASGCSSSVTEPLSASTVTGNSGGAGVVSTAADEVDGGGGAAVSSSPPHETRTRASRTATRAARGR